MAQKLKTKLKVNKQAVQATQEKLRSAILWLLAGRKWHSEMDVRNICGLCISDEEALNQYEVWKASNERPSTLPAFEADLSEDRVAHIVHGQELLLTSAVDSLVEEGYCRMRQDGGMVELQRVRLDARSRPRIKVMNAAFQDALHQAETWLRAGTRPINPVSDLVAAMRNPVDNYAAWPVAHVVANWFQNQVESRKGDEGQAAAQVPFWLNAGFFTDRRLFYISTEAPNAATRYACKAVLVEVLNGTLKDAPEWILDEVPELVAEWLRENAYAALSVAMIDSLLGAFIQMGWAFDQIDWHWIAERLTAELERHRHRRRNRALELATGMPFEHIEAKLGYFVGTFEEMVLKVTQAQ